MPRTSTKKVADSTHTEEKTSPTAATQPAAESVATTPVASTPERPAAAKANASAPVPAQTDGAQSSEKPTTLSELKPVKRVPVIPLGTRPQRSAVRPASRPSNSYTNTNSSHPASASGHTSHTSHATHAPRSTKIVEGFLDTSRDGHGVVRVAFNGSEDIDAYISTAMIRRYRIRPGDVVSGPVREPKENERYWGMLQVETINGKPVAEAMKEDRAKFQKLTPVYPDEQMKLETGDEPLSMRIIDMIAPIGKGQRSLIVSPPKAGKTTFLKEVATGIAVNHPDVHLMAVLVGERPEEVTDIKRHIEALTKGKGEVAASNFDEPSEDQCRVAELALERAKRLVEMGKDVVILLDSITRLARAYNLSIPTSGRTLSGGFDPAALFPPKRFFGAARNFEIQGSLTIIGTALVDTGSRMDDLIYEEFKGTGNQEVHLDRRLAERRIYPAIDVQRSGTRRDDLLMDAMTYQSIMTLHRMLDMLDKEERTSTLIEQLKKTKSNKEFLASLKVG